MAPVSPYGVSKASGELLLLQYWRSYGLHVVVGRFFIHLAPRGTSALALHEFARQVARAELELQEPVLLHGTISTLRDITDIRDSGPAVVCMTETAESGTVANVGSGRSFSMEQVLNMSLKHARVAVTPQLDPARVRPYDEKAVLADMSKFSNLTGFAPVTPLEETARAIVEYWRGEIAAAMASNPTGASRAEL
jgi:nucleoside-diphosphate-sugar epimerase